MTERFSIDTLVEQNHRFHGTAGVSAGNHSRGFVPAFFDEAQGRTYRSRFANGTPAPIHLLDGLPEELVLERSPAGAVKAVKRSLISGFLRDGCFYTREEAAALV
jgi:hypothetical protein